MSFQPVVPFGGIAGWTFLQRTMKTQRAAFDAAPERQRDVEYFRERIGGVTSAEALVADRRLRGVALGAFGLDGDIDSRAFIRKVLEEGTREPAALANKLTDSRYREFSAAFGFGNGTLPRTGRTGFGEEIVSLYLDRQFEIGVGAQDQAMRLALTLERELPRIAARGISQEAKWLTVMGNPPLRRVFETAMGLPRSFGALDLDRQLGEFRERAEGLFGLSRFDDLGESATREKVRRIFLAKAQLGGGFGPGGMGPAAPAVAILAQISGLAPSARV